VSFRSLVFNLEVTAKPFYTPFECSSRRPAYCTEGRRRAARARSGLEGCTRRAQVGCHHNELSRRKRTVAAAAAVTALGVREELLNLFSQVHFDHARGSALRHSIVAPAQRSPAAAHKARTKRTEDNMPVHSFQTLLKDLATIVKNTIQPRPHTPTFEKVTRPTPLQQRALDLLRVKL